MAYRNFTLDTVLEAFDLEEVDTAGIFADSEPVAPSELLTAVLARNIPLALAGGTEGVRRLKKHIGNNHHGNPKYNTPKT